MAGHSKWANIKHRKANQDAKRGKIFTKLIRELTVSAKQGGDVAANPRLRAAVDKALSNNMKRDSIDKAIARGSGNLDGVNYEEMRYEGYATSGVAIIVDCLTDNKQRTVSEVRHAFSKHGGNLGTDGSVAYMFNHRGFIQVSSEADEDKLFEVALENGAEDVEVDDAGNIIVATDAEHYLNVKEAIVQAGFECLQSELALDADVKIELTEEQAEKVINLVDTIEDLDDVQAVHSNLEII